MDRGRKKQLSFGVLLSYLTIISQCVSGILYTPIILHSFGQSVYGVYSLVFSFAGYLNIFDGGMNAAYVRFYVQTKTKDEEKLPVLNGIFAKIFSLIAIGCLFIGLFIGWKAEWFFGNKINPDEYTLLKKLFVILAFFVCVRSINCIFSSLIIAHEKFIFGKMTNLIRLVIEPIITIPFLLNGSGAVAVFLIKLILSILITVFNVIYCVAKLHVSFQFDSHDKIVVKEVLVFAGAISLQLVMDQLNWQIDKLILAWTNGTLQISIYSVGSTINNYYTTLAAAMSGVFIAEINRLVAQNKEDELSKLFIKCSRLFSMFVLLIMSGYCVYGYFFIQRWAGIGYEDSFVVGLLLMLPVTPSLIFGLGQDIVRAKNLHKLQIYINFAVCICNLIISIPLAMKFGAIGSAIGTFVSEIIICVIVETIYYSKVAKLDMKTGYKELLHMLYAVLLPVLYGVIILHLHLVKSTYTSIIIYALPFIGIYALSMWLISMNDYEKNIIKKAVTKIRIK